MVRGDHQHTPGGEGDDDMFRVRSDCRASFCERQLERMLGRPQVCKTPDEGVGDQGAERGFRFCSVFAGRAEFPGREGQLEHERYGLVIVGAGYPKVMLWGRVFTRPSEG